MKIVDIAAAAGLSPSTVSRVIHGSAKISPKTASLVYKTMEEIGCPALLDGDQRIFLHRTPSFLHRVAAVLTFGDLLPADLLCCTEMLRILSQALASEGHSMIYHHFSDERQALCPWMHFVCGAIILQGRPHDSMASWLARKPYVTINGAGLKGEDHLFSGHNRIGQLAGQYLIDQGATRFAAVNALPELPETVGQIEGFRCFLLRNSTIRYDELSSAQDDPFDASKGIPECFEARLLPLVGKILDWKEDRAGIFVPNNLMTAALYRLILKYGGNPSNYIFISSGNCPAAFYGLHPRPATIDIDLDSVARNAVNLLLIRVHKKGTQKPFHISVEPKIIEGEWNKI